MNELTLSTSLTGEGRTSGRTGYTQSPVGEDTERQSVVQRFLFQESPLGEIAIAKQVEQKQMTLKNQLKSLGHDVSLRRSGLGGYFTRLVIEY